MAITLDGTNGITTPDLESSGPVIGTTGTFSGNVSGVAGTFSGAVQASGVSTNLYPLVSATAVVNPTSPASSSINFTGIPSWVKRITVMFSEASLSSTADILIRLGDAEGIEDTGYISTSATAAANSSSTTGFVIRVAAAANVLSGIAIIQNVTGNSWVCSHSTKVATTATPCGGGSKTLSDTLTQIRITTTSTDTFDAGTINIMYE